MGLEDLDRVRTALMRGLSSTVPFGEEDRSEIETEDRGGGGGRDGISGRSRSMNDWLWNCDLDAPRRGAWFLGRRLTEFCCTNLAGVCVSSHRSL